MQVPLAVLADYANVTADGKLNIMGIFDIIYAPQVSFVHPQMQLVMKLRTDIGKKECAKCIRNNVTKHSLNLKPHPGRSPRNLSIHDLHRLSPERQRRSFRRAKATMTWTGSVVW